MMNTLITIRTPPYLCFMFLCLCYTAQLTKGLKIQYFILNCINSIKSIFRFNSESDMTTFLQTEHQVYHLERDLYIPGNILFIDGYAMKTTDGSSTSLIAGSVTQRGYVEGVGSQARFYFILSFLQISIISSSQIITITA